jgi:hypothetical protein
MYVVPVACPKLHAVHSYIPSLSVNVPYPHAWHVVVEVENVPFRHCVQTGLPGVVDIVPIGQLKHPPGPVENLPAGQLVHTDLAVRGLVNQSLNIPGEHQLHVVLPSVRATVPVEQAIHVVLPRVLLYVPTGQLLHTLVESKNCPASQGAQVLAMSYNGAPSVPINDHSLAIQSLQVPVAAHSRSVRGAAVVTPLFTSVPAGQTQIVLPALCVTLSFVHAVQR